jgi:hypothetical protein
LRFHKAVSSRENKKPAEFYRLSGPNLKKCFLIKSAISGVHLRRRDRARDDGDGGDGDETAFVYRLRVAEIPVNRFAGAT